MSSQTERNITAVLTQAGYFNSRKVTDTLQGSIWASRRKKSKESVIVKVTSRRLHAEGMILVDGQKYAVSEDIVKEQEILKFLTVAARKAQQNGTLPPGAQRVVRFVDFFQSNSNFYFAMEHGGHMLFDFVVRVHRYIETGKLDIAHWRHFVRALFVQIVDAVQFIHSHGVCHFDISLENLLINDVEVVLDPDGKIRFCSDAIEVKLCDFGLAERFAASGDDDDEKGVDSRWSTKMCGKPNYKSPECAEGEGFDAVANDTWCVGVCLFMMLLGGNLYQTATPDDQSLAQAMDGKLGQLLASWGREHFVDDLCLDLLHSIFQREALRCDLDSVAEHKWVVAGTAAD